MYQCINIFTVNKLSDKKFRDTILFIFIQFIFLHQKSDFKKRLQNTLDAVIRNEKSAELQEKLKVNVRQSS